MVRKSSSSSVSVPSADPLAEFVDQEMLIQYLVKLDADIKAASVALREMRKRRKISGSYLKEVSDAS